ncbi:hypothetical protein KIL84_020253 [Mauremys mutica]|uniref:Uncharacterized protein n=1 Tax=Mauremys mutica TaxID=74926 RepID=A0A9D3XVB2_9SAUR|nr:hypothetical protein KIL84_020253 [Mauremys mutica]
MAGVEYNKLHNKSLILLSFTSITKLLSSVVQYQAPKYLSLHFGLNYLNAEVFDCQCVQISDTESILLQHRMQLVWATAMIYRAQIKISKQGHSVAQLPATAA